jgi:NAD(P)H dehydrogenase (quinone)
MVITGLPYSFTELTKIAEVRGGSPYGAGTNAAADGSRTPNNLELRLAHDQEQHVASIAKRLAR